MRANRLFQLMITAFEIEETGPASAPLPTTSPRDNSTHWRTGNRKMHANHTIRNVCLAPTSAEPLRSVQSFLGISHPCVYHSLVRIISVILAVLKEALRASHHRGCLVFYCRQRVEDGRQKMRAMCLDKERPFLHEATTQKWDGQPSLREQRAHNSPLTRRQSDRE